MIKYEELKKIIEESNDEELKDKFKSSNPQNYVENFKKLTYEEKRYILHFTYSQQDGMDEIVKNDAEFLKKFKSDNSPKNMAYKAYLNKAEIEKYFDMDKFLGDENITPKEILSCLYNIDIQRVLGENNLKRKILNNDEIIDRLSSDAKVKRDFLTIISFSDCTDILNNSDKLKDIIKEDFKERLRKNNSYFSSPILKMDNSFKDEIMSEIKNNIQPENLSTENLDFILNSLINKYEKVDVETNQKNESILEEVIDGNYDIFENKSERFFKTFFEFTNSPKILEKLFQNENTRNIIVKNYVKEVMKKDIGTELKIKYLNEYIDKNKEDLSEENRFSSWYKINISNFDESTQKYIISNYSEYGQAIDFNVDKNEMENLNNEVFSQICQNAQILDSLKLSTIIDYKKIINIDNEYLINRIKNNSQSSMYDRDLEYPQEIINMLSKEEKKILYLNLNYFSAQKMLENNSDPMLRACIEYKIDNEIERGFFFDSYNYYGLANDEQKKIILDNVNFTEKILIYEKNKNSNILENIVENDEYINNLNEKELEKLLEHINSEQFQRIKTHIAPSTLINLDIRKIPEDSEIKVSINNDIKELLKNDKELYEKVNPSTLRDMLFSNDIELEELSKYISLNKELQIINEFAFGEDKKKINSKVKEDLLNRMREMDDIDISGEELAQKFSFEEYEEFLNKLNTQEKLNILGSYNTPSEKYDQIIESIDRNQNIDFENGYHNRSYRLIMDRLSKEERQKLNNRLKVEDLVTLVVDNSDDYFNEIEESIFKRYEENLEVLSKVKEGDLQRFLDNSSEELSKKIYDTSRKCILEKFNIDSQDKLYERLQNGQIGELKKINEILENGYYSGKNKEKIDYALQKNKYALINLNTEILSEKFSEYSPELFEKIIRYSSLQKDLVAQSNSSDLNKFNAMIQSLSDGRENMATITVLVSNLYNEAYKNKENKKIFDMLEDNITASQAENLKEYLLRKECLVYGGNKEIAQYRGSPSVDDVINVDINSAEDIANYKENLYKKCDEIFSKTDKIEEKLNAFSTKYLGMSYKEMNIMYNSYYEGMSDWYNKNKDNIKEIPAELNTLTLIDSLINLKNTKDIDTIDELYNEYGKINGKLDRESVEIMENNIKRTIAKDISENIYKVDEKNKSREVEYKGRKIPIIEADGEFKMLVHSVDAYIKNDDESQNYLDSWNDSKRTENHGICCSMIANNYLGTAPLGNVLLCFDNFSDESLQYMAPCDVYSLNDTFRTNVSREVSYLTAEETINHTRHTHNEITIDRNENRDKEDLPSKDRKFNNIQPSAVIIYKDMSEELKENALKSASDFNIPIVEIDREKCAQNSAQKIDNYIDEYNKKKDVSIIKKVIVEHENNRCGLRMERQDLVDKYFDIEKIDKFLATSIDELVEQKENNEISQEDFEYNLKCIACYFKEEETKFDATNEAVARISNIDFKVGKYEFDIMKNINYYSQEQQCQIPKIVENIPEIENLDKENVKNINQLIIENEKYIKNPQDKKSLEKRALYLHEIDNSSDDEKYLSFEALKFDFMPEEDRKKVLEEKKPSSMQLNEKILTAAVKMMYAKDEVEKEKIKLDYNISGEHEKRMTTLIDNIDNVKKIESGQIDKTNLSKKDRRKMDKYSKLIDEQYEREVEENAKSK